VSRAAVILGLGLAALFLVLHLLGLRDDVSILSGTMPGGSLEAAGGLLYALAFFSTVIIAPVLLASAGLHWLSTRCLRSGLR
jgi:hypothetical protein